MDNHPQINNKSEKISFKLYLDKVADYIDAEYGGFDSDVEMTDDEKYTIKTMMHHHYYSEDSINNAANEIIVYLRKNRNWKENN